MIRSCFDEKTQNRLVFKGVRDYPYDDFVWLTQVQNIVKTEQEKSVQLEEGSEPVHEQELAKITTCLVGHYKDDTSYYLKMFPQWKFEEFYTNKKESSVLNATDIRNIMFQGLDLDDNVKSLVPEPVLDFIKEFIKTETYETLAQGFEYLVKYKEDTKFVNLPFPPTFIATDAVVTSAGHILVIKRGFNPGKGLLALPGGFLDTSLTLRQNAIKELKEETRMNVPSMILDSSIVKFEVFDHPNRSLRGRTITHAFHFDLKISAEKGLPSVKGGDDASGAMWIPLSEFFEREDEVFEDHAHIVRKILGIV